MQYRVILGTLKLRTALHLGTGAGGDVTDDLCRRDGEGNFLLPGTAIGGALRTIATRLAPRLGLKTCHAMRNTEETCGCPVCHLFGEIYPGEGNDELSGGRASRLLIAHATAILPANQSQRIRDQVGIDRVSRTSASASAAKFDLEVLPAGTQFQLRIEMEEVNDTDEQLLAAALAEWQAGRAWIGGCIARGLGAFDLRDVRMKERDLAQPGQLMAFLNSDEPWWEAGEISHWSNDQLSKARQRLQSSMTCLNDIAHSFVSMRFNLRVEGLFLTNDTTAAARSGFDHTILLDVLNNTGKPLLPGASLRGALRSHAERIARTLNTLEARDKDDFWAKCPACNPLELRPEEPLANCDTLLREIAGISDEEEVSAEQLCPACRLFGSTRRGSRLIVEDAVAEADATRKVLDFLAIDRFTGGGKVGAKFDALAVWKPSFVVRLHLENPAAWELGWLALVLRDLQDGMLTVGFGAAKGFGQVRMEALTVSYGFISDDDFAGPSIFASAQTTVTSGLYRLLQWDKRDSAQRDQLRQLEAEWVIKFHELSRQAWRSDFPHAVDLPRPDTFFGTAAESLYGKARVI